MPLKRRTSSARQVSGIGIPEANLCRKLRALREISPVIDSPNKKIAASQLSTDVLGHTADSRYAGAGKERTVDTDQYLAWMGRLRWNGRFCLAACYCNGSGSPSLAAMVLMVLGSTPSPFAKASSSTRCP